TRWNSGPCLANGKSLSQPSTSRLLMTGRFSRHSSARCTAVKLLIIKKRYSINTLQVIKMKPIRLEMNYFGPFEAEQISFDSVKHSLFLISGKTGSGKTMIFDALTYALYGTLSTNGRQESSVRSQFAADTDISSVKLTFEIRGSQYTVERVLPYYKEGRKSQVPPKAVLYDADGSLLDSSINGVKEKVEEIIQLTSDQFRQILILPQGEFKKLLTSTSESKQEIL